MRALKCCFNLKSLWKITCEGGGTPRGGVVGGKGVGTYLWAVRPPQAFIRSASESLLTITWELKGMLWTWDSFTWGSYLKVVDRSSFWSSSSSELLLWSEAEDFGSGCSWPDSSVADWGEKSTTKTQSRAPFTCIKSKIHFQVGCNFILGYVDKGIWRP